MAGHRSHLHSCRIPRGSAPIFFAVRGIHVHRDLREDGLDELEKISADNTLHRAAEGGREVRNAPTPLALLFCAALGNSLLRALDSSTCRSFQSYRAIIWHS